MIKITGQNDKTAVQDEKVRLWTREYVITTFVNFLVAMNYLLLMIVISEYAMNELHASSGIAGLSAGIFVIGALVARLFTGKYIAQTGCKKMLCTGLVSALVASLAYFCAGNVALLIAVRFIHGATFGVISTSAATIIADIVPEKRRGEGIGYYSLSQTLATAIGPFLGMWFSRSGNYNMIFTACTVVAAACVLTAPFLSLKKLALTEEQIKGMKGFRLSNFIEYKAVPISIIALLIYVCYSSIVSFIAVYAKEIDLVEAAGFFFIVEAIVVLASRPSIGKTFDRRGEHVIMYPAIAAFGAGMFLFSQSYQSMTLLLAAACIGLGLGAIQLSTQAIAVKVASQHRMGLANSTYFMLCDIGIGAGPVLVGFMIPFTSYRGMYAVMAAVTFACIFLYFLLHGRSKSLYD
ncbi:MAG: MFS transporter [Elusimicrobiota bacterium]|jgi:MFS family permease|nr:MFS transporter [Elusimicrobiota bacterium]